MKTAFIAKSADDLAMWASFARDEGIDGVELLSYTADKAKVAELALKAGAEIINDISGFIYDSRMADIAAENSAACIVMHIKGTPKNMQVNPVYIDVVKEIYDFINKQVSFLKNKKIDRIIIDPGFGFGKSLKDNYIILKTL